MLVERACVDIEAKIIAFIKGLMREHIAPQSITPVRSSSQRLATRVVQEERRSSEQHRTEAAVAVLQSVRGYTRLEEPVTHPVLKQYYQSPYVDVALKY